MLARVHACARARTDLADDGGRVSLVRTIAHNAVRELVERDAVDEAAEIMDVVLPPHLTLSQHFQSPNECKYGKRVSSEVIVRESMARCVLLSAGWFGYNHKCGGEA